MKLSTSYTSWSKSASERSFIIEGKNLIPATKQNLSIRIAQAMLKNEKVNTQVNNDTTRWLIDDKLQNLLVALESRDWKVLVAMSEQVGIIVQ